MPVTFIAGGKRFRLTPRQLGVEVDWAAAVASAAAAGRRLRLRPRLPPARARVLPGGPRAADARLRRGARLRARPARARRSTRRTARRGSSAAGCTSRSPPARPAACSTARPRAATIVARARLVLARAGRAAGARRSRRRSRSPRSPPPSGARRSDRRAGHASPPGRRACASRAGGSRRSSSSRRRRTPISLGGPAADAYFARLENAGRPRAEGRRLRRQRRRQRSRRARAPGLALDVPRVGGAHPRRGRASDRTASRTLALVAAQPQRTTAEAQAMGITGTVGTYETFYGGDPNRIHNVQLVAHLVDGKLIAPGATFSFNGATGERTRGEGLPRGAGDHQRRAPDRPRRRRLPGLDDGLQRRVRGGPADHRAHEPRALHLALPARPRRDRQLPGHRPQVRQRHRALAAAPHVRRLVVADRRPLRRRRSTAASRRRPRRCASSRRRRSRRRSTRRSTPGDGRRRRLGRARRRRPRSSARSTRRAASCSPTRPGTRATASEPKRRSASGRRRRRSRRRRRRRRRPRRRPRRRRRRRRRRSRLRLLRTSDRLDQPGGHAGRPQRRRVDGRVRRPAVGDQHARRARSRTRSGSARRARRRSARARRSRSSKRAGCR